MLSRISRIIVGALFIVSGLIKANDPVGFSYKLNDYFAPGVFNLPWLDGIALQLAVFVCVAEIVLGIAMLFGARMKLGAWSLLLLMIFFTFLTGYTAVANWLFDNYESGLTHSVENIFGFVIREEYSYMKDCGCFGDAIKLDPWESFLKDVILMIFTVIIFIKRKSVISSDLKSDLVNLGISLLLIAGFSFGMLHWGFPVIFSIAVFLLLLGIKYFISSASKDWIMAGAATIVTAWLCIHCINHLPLKDFRPYRIGNYLPDLMIVPDGERETPHKIMEYVYDDGNREVTVKYDTDKNTFEPAIDTTWTFARLGSEATLEEAYEPPIHDFVLEDADGSDMTEAILTEPHVLLVISYDINKANGNAQKRLNEIYNASNQSGGPYMYAITANGYNDTEQFRHEYQNMFDYLTADATMLKTIIRSNPGLVLLGSGTVLAKWHYNDLPDYAEIKSYLK